MKKFMLKIFGFLGLVLFVLAGNYLFNSYQLKKAPSLGGASNVVVGDSRMMTAVNPERLDNCINIAQNSESYIISFFKLKYLLKHNPGIKRILLGFSYPSFSAYLDRIFKNDVATSDVLNRIYPIMSMNDFKGLELDEEKYYQVLFKNMLAYPHTNHHKYMGGFSKLKPGIERANLNSTINRHYFDKDSNNIGISKIAKQYLDSIIQLTQSNQVELVLVNVPLHKDYIAAVPKNFVDYYEMVKSEMLQRNIKVLDYGHLVLDDKYFKDYNHLDEEGANLVTDMIKRDLQVQ